MWPLNSKYNISVKHFQQSPINISISFNYFLNKNNL